MAELLLGEITHFYGKIRVAVLALSDTIQVGDTVHIQGHTTDFQQEVRSLQIEHQPVMEAQPGQDVALKVAGRVRRGDRVFKVLADEQPTDS